MPVRSNRPHVPALELLYITLLGLFWVYFCQAHDIGCIPPICIFYRGIEICDGNRRRILFLGRCILSFLCWYQILVELNQDA